LRRLLEQRKIEYAELTFYGDTRYRPEGKQLREVLHRAAAAFERRLGIWTDVYEGPAMNHSYHEMIIGHGKCFSTVLLSEKQEHLSAPKYDPDYHIAQFLATRLALERKGRRVVALLLKDMSDESIARLDEFFREAAVYLK